MQGEIRTTSSPVRSSFEKVRVSPQQGARPLKVFDQTSRPDLRFTWSTQQEPVLVCKQDEQTCHPRVNGL